LLRFIVDKTFANGVFQMKLKSRSGQSTVEYMLLISVVVIAIVAAAYVFLDPFKSGVEELGNEVSTTLSTGNIRSSGGN
jgi:uncharacterized protein (UPF0333 family)